MTMNSLDMTTAGFTRSLSTASVKISYSVKVTGDAVDRLLENPAVVISNEFTVIIIIMVVVDSCSISCLTGAVNYSLPCAALMVTDDVGIIRSPPMAAVKEYLKAA